ncbi:MAG: serine/threonine-protein kinase [Geodermatophilaceae bacterium]
MGSRYRLQERLGNGGMGAVWAAHDAVLGRDVAINQVVLPAANTPEQRAEIRERSLREARAAARINCPYAVHVFDVVEEDCELWIVMERVPGRSLSDLIQKRGRLPAAQVIRIAQQILEALTTAHSSGVLHRDVKPSNVLIRPDGSAVLTDFGIAAVDGDPSITATGLVIGSPGYLAPERAAGGPATAATDLWALGCLIFAAYDGRSPFVRADSMATMQAVLTEEPALPGGPLAPVLRGLLAKNIVLRLSAETTRLMLRAAAASPLVAARATAAPGRPEPWAVSGPPAAGAFPLRRRRSGSHRRRSLLPVLLAALVAVGTLTVAAVAKASSDDEQRPPAADRPAAVETSAAREPSVLGGALGPSTDVATTDPAPSDVLRPVSGCTWTGPGSPSRSPRTGPCPRTAR